MFQLTWNGSCLSVGATQLSSTNDLWFWLLAPPPQLHRRWRSCLMSETVRSSWRWNPTFLWTISSGITSELRGTWRRRRCRWTSFPCASWKLRPMATPAWISTDSCLLVRHTPFFVQDIRLILVKVTPDHTCFSSQATPSLVLPDVNS